MVAYLTDIWFNIAWMIELAGFLILIIAINYVLRRLFERFKHQRMLHQNDWRYNLDQAVLTPFRTLLWIFFVAFVIDLVARQFELKQLSFDPTTLRNAGIIVCATWFLFRWKTLVVQAVESRRHAGKKTLDPASMEIIGKIYSIGVLFIATLILLQIFGLNIAPLLAFGGIGAAALGLASKDMIANLYGGLTLYMTRPFSIGDQIELPQKKLTGTIEQIGWYFTTLRDLGKKPYYIPNSIFTTEMVVNASRITHRYIDEILSIRYEDAEKLDRLIQEIRHLLQRHSDIDREEPIYVHLHSLASSSIHLEIRAYTITTSYKDSMEIKQKILIQICALLRQFGASVGYPVQEVYLHNSAH